MPKINVYLPDELADAVRASGVPVSTICQRALETAVREVRGFGLDATVVPALASFTDRTRKVTFLANAAAQADNVDVGSEHVLLGLIAEGTGVAARALGALGITEQAVKRSMQTRGSSADGNDVYRAALKEALKLGHSYVGTEHVLLGLAETPCTGRDVLAELGANRRAVKHQVMSILTSSPSMAQPNVDAKLDEVLQRLDALEKRFTQ